MGEDPSSPLCWCGHVEEWVLTLLIGQSVYVYLSSIVARAAHVCGGEGEE